jgi:hypothetical protein
MSDDTHADIPRSWTCFHCDETFTTVEDARNHFGFDIASDPACRIKIGAERGLVAALRRAEQDAADAWARLHNESGDAVVAYAAAVTRHSEQLRTVEEAGYEKGLADGRAEAAAATYPEELTPVLLNVLGLMNFQTCPLAEILRADGEDIPRKAEIEQARVLHWMIGLALKHGDKWREKVTERIERVVADVRSKEGNAQ